MPHAIALTERQTELLEAIKSFRAKKGFTPTYADLAKILGISGPRVYQQVQCLQIARAIKIVDKKIQIGDEIPYTEKQLKVAKMFAKHPGASQSEIAVKLDITPETLNADYLPRLVALGAIEVNDGAVKVLDKGLA